MGIFQELILIFMPKLGIFFPQRKGLTMKLGFYRRNRKLTQEQVANILGIPKKTYQNYEREVREADSDVLCALADYYGITLDELVGRTETAAEPETPEEGLVRLYRKMNEDGREALMIVAEALAEKFGR